MKEWLNTGEVIFGDDLNGNFTALADGSAIQADAITPEKINLGEESVTVATEQQTTTTSYSDAPTSGPTVTMTVSGTRTVLLAFGANMTNSTAGQGSYITPEITGATTVTAADGNSLFARATTTNAPYQTASRTLITTLNPGTSVIQLKYRVSGGTASFERRYLQVIPIG